MASSQGPSSSQGSSAVMVPPPSTGSFYGALEECDRQARQRKYQIAELEDKIEHVEKTGKQSRETIAKLKAEIEKWKVEAKAAQMMYENKLKEKQLVENEFRALSKTMDKVTEDIARKKSRMQEIKLFQQQKIDHLIKTEEKFMHQYRQNPKIAKVIDVKEVIQEVEVMRLKANQELERRRRLCQELQNIYADAWELFKTKCVKMAELYVERQKKKQELQSLRGDYERTFRTVGAGATARQSQISRQSHKPLEAPPSVAGVSRSTFLKPITPNRMEGFGSRTGVATSIPRRSSTFQQLDRMCQSNVLPDKPADRRSLELGDRTRTYLSSGSSMQNASALAIQIRSKLKGTVQPMPRNQESRNVNVVPVAKTTVAGGAAVPQPRQERDAQPPVVDLCTPPPPRSNQGERDYHQMEQMEVTEDVIKEHSQQQEKIHDLSGPGTHQEMGEPVTAADHFEVQPQSACNDGLLQMPTQPNGFIFSAPAGETANSPTKPPPEGSSFDNIFGGMSSLEPSTSEGSGGFSIFSGDPFCSSSTPTTTQGGGAFGFFF